MQLPVSMECNNTCLRKSTNSAMWLNSAIIRNHIYGYFDLLDVPSRFEMSGRCKKQSLFANANHSAVRKTLTYTLACITCPNHQCFPINSGYEQSQNNRQGTSIRLEHHRSRICNFAGPCLVVWEISLFQGWWCLDIHLRNLSPRFPSLFRCRELSAILSAGVFSYARFST